MNSKHHSKYTHVPDQDLLTLTARAASHEKKAQLLLLDYLLEVDVRRLYAIKAYSTLFEYVVKELGYSEPAAAERVSAVRLMRAVPEVKTHLEEGRLTLTSASQIQRFIKTEEKTSPHSISPDQKIAIVESCLDQSKREVEKTLLAKQSAEAQIFQQEKIRLVTPERTELRFTVGETTVQKMQRVREVIGETSLENLFEQALHALLLQEQKKRGRDEKPAVKTIKKTVPKAEAKTATEEEKVTRPAELNEQWNQRAHSRFVPISLKRFLFKRAEGRCEYVHPETQKRCESRYRLQVDHIYPFALGGKTDAANARILCSSHNLRAAEEWGFGKN